MRSSAPLRLLPVSVFLLFFAVALASGQNSGQIFTVNSSADSVDAAPGDGRCADSQGRCTLRAAVEESNAGAASRDIIIFSLQYPAVIDLTLGELTVTGTGLSIVGPGARRLGVLRFGGGVPAFRAFNIPNAGTSVVLRGFSISEAATGFVGQVGSGGAVRVGPGASLHLADASLWDHKAASGGAIFNEGQLNISRVLLHSNSAQAGGAAIATTAGSNTRILNTTITLNSAQTGGGIYAEGSLLCVNCTITHNTATNSASSIRSGSSNEVSLLNSIVGSDTSFPVTSLSGTFLSHGNNLVTDARTSTGFVHGVKNDQVSDNNVISPLLGPLADNGGQTNTRSLMGASPAIDAGNSCVFLGQCPMFGPQDQPRLIWDQRVNYTRGGILNAVDIGAYESGNGGSTSSSSFGTIPFGNGAFLYNSQTVLINVETGERIYRSIGPRGIQRFNNLPSGVVFVSEVRTKRAGVKPPPMVIAFPD